MSLKRYIVFICSTIQHLFGELGRCGSTVFSRKKNISYFFLIFFYSRILINLVVIVFVTNTHIRCQFGIDQNRLSKRWIQFSIYLKKKKTNLRPKKESCVCLFHVTTNNVHQIRRNKNKLVYRTFKSLMAWNCVFVATADCVSVCVCVFCVQPTSLTLRIAHSTWFWANQMEWFCSLYVCTMDI